MTSYYATTYVYQNNIEYECTHDFTGDADETSAVNHLTAILQCPADAFDGYGDAMPELHMLGFKPTELAEALVYQEEKMKELGITWVISTKFEEADEDNWCHPRNL